MAGFQTEVFKPWKRSGPGGLNPEDPSGAQGDTNKVLHVEVGA